MKIGVLRSLSILLICFSSASLFSVEAARARETISYGHYVNVRYKFAIDYPAKFIPLPESDNGDGRTFSSKSDQAQLIAFGRQNFNPASVDQSPWTARTLMQDELASRKEGKDKVTYKTSGKDWVVLSGVSADERIFYFKALIRDDGVKCFELRYPKTRKAMFDPVVAHLVASFKHTE